MPPLNGDNEQEDDVPQPRVPVLDILEDLERMNREMREAREEELRELDEYVHRCVERMTDPDYDSTFMIGGVRNNFKLYRTPEGVWCLEVLLWPNEHPIMVQVWRQEQMNYGVLRCLVSHHNLEYFSPGHHVDDEDPEEDPVDDDYPNFGRDIPYFDNRENLVVVVDGEEHRM